MRKVHVFTALVTVLAAAGMVFAAAAQTGGELKSGPQVGQTVPGPFHPLNCNGKSEGKKNCLYCEHGTAPVAMLFARDVSPQLTKLIKQIDASTAKHQDVNMGSFVVFLSDKEELAKALKDLANKEKLQHTVLALDNPAGPEGYDVARDASITVVLYYRHTVVVNRVFRSPSDLSDKVINQIVADVAKIQPK